MIFSFELLLIMVHNKHTAFPAGVAKNKLEEKL
jgi:hypothetical protein